MDTVQEDAIAPAIRRAINAQLTAIEKEEDVRLLLAVESGSRAWSFPSPDSEYDIRFVYVRRRDRYLSLTPGRDVIETPIENDIDLNGKDIRKALGLLLKSNAVVSERIGSPIRNRPMNLQALIAATELRQLLTTQIDELVDAKRRTNERANGARLPDVDALIRDEFARAGDIRATTPDPRLQAEAERLFLELVNT